METFQILNWPREDIRDMAPKSLSYNKPLLTFVIWILALLNFCI